MNNAEKLSLPEQKIDLEKKVVELIKIKGQKDPEVSQLFNELLLNKEAEFGPESKGQVGLDIWRAQFYKEIGDREYAIEILEDILDILTNISLDELRPKIEEEIKKIESED